LGIDAYATPALVAYRQTAFSFVLRPNAVCVVPTARVPEGVPFERTGGVVSATVYVTVSAADVVLPAASWAVAVRMLTPLWSAIPGAVQFAVPEAVPLPPRSFDHVIGERALLSPAVPPSVSGLTPVL
jgi:hypothetical protein